MKITKRTRYYPGESGNMHWLEEAHVEAGYFVRDNGEYVMLGKWRTAIEVVIVAKWFSKQVDSRTVRERATREILNELKEARNKEVSTR